MRHDSQDASTSLYRVKNEGGRTWRKASGRKIKQWGVGGYVAPSRTRAGAAAWFTCKEVQEEEEEAPLHELPNPKKPQDMSSSLPARN